MVIKGSLSVGRYRRYEILRACSGSLDVLCSDLKHLFEVDPDIRKLTLQENDDLNNKASA